MVVNGLEKKRDVGAPVGLPAPLFRVIGGLYALLLLVLVVALPAGDEFVVDTVVDADGDEEDTDFKYFKLSP